MSEVDGWASYMAVIRSMVPLADLIEQRDALSKAYTAAAATMISQYSMQERQVLYEQRAAMRAEINALNRKIALADPSVNARGYTKADFRGYRFEDNSG